VNSIESNINTLDASVNSIESNITTLDSSVNSIESNITTLDVSVNSIESNITTLDASVNSIESNITTLDSSVNSIESSITTLDASVNNLDSRVVTLETSSSNGITVKQESSNDANDASYNNVTTLSFDYDAGFNIEDLSSGEVKVSLGSHWKTIQLAANGGAISGDSQLVPSGEETLKLVAGNNITFVGNSSSDPQSITIVSSGGGGGGGGGSGIDISGNSANLDVLENESKIVYDVSRNIFLGASRAYGDDSGQASNPVKFEPLGYSFFRENMEGQPPAPAQNSFFFFITSKTIVIKWTNPKQYETGITAQTSQLLDKTAPIVTAPTSNTGGQVFFPIVNRIMIQIKNLDDNSYQTWGENVSSVSKVGSGGAFPNGRIICEKAQIIPPAINTASSSNYFGPTYQTHGRSNKVHRLDEFANSIILYKNQTIPDVLEEDSNGNSISLVDKRIYSAKQTSDNENSKYTIPDSENGFEIKIWLENQYTKKDVTTQENIMTSDDFNVTTLTTMDRMMDESGNHITDNSNSLYSFIGQPIRFLVVDPPTKIRVANYDLTNDVLNGFNVQLKRISGTSIHYLECIIPANAVNSNILTNEDNEKVESTQSSGQENEVYFKGYFIEYQTVEADVNKNKTMTELATEFNNNGTSWQFAQFETFSSGSISFNSGRANDTSATKTMASDTEAELNSVIWDNAGTTNDNNYGFISASEYNGGFATITNTINYSVSKAFRLMQGDNKFYRFRIRGLNNGNKQPGPVSTKYFYIRFNEPEKISWTTPNPKFLASQLAWNITLNWNNTIKSSKRNAVIDPSGILYDINNLAIMEYKLQRRDTSNDAANTKWQTISYWNNNNFNSQMQTRNYQIWPTPPQTIDSNYASHTGWSTSSVSNSFAEWVYYETSAGGTKIYTQEARLLANDQSVEKTYASRNPVFQFRIQARNYLFGKRTDSDNSNALVTTTKQWFKETESNIVDTRWSEHSESSTALITTAHTSIHTNAYTPVLHDNQNDKYVIKFYEEDSADANSPWKNSNGVTDYGSSSRPVKYTTNSSANRTTNNNAPYNSIPTQDYIGYQWKLASAGTTVDSTTGLSIDRYEIVETINMGRSGDPSDTQTIIYQTIIYSPDFRYGPANWHVNEYTAVLSTSPSFKFKVRAFNFFNSSASNYSSDSVSLTPTQPSAPRFLSSSATSGVNGKETSNPTFSLTDSGLTILVDEPEFTGQTTENSSQYQNQGISLSEFALEKFTKDGSIPDGEIVLINGHGSTSRSGNSIKGNNSQVAQFFHPNGHENVNSKLKDMTNGVINYSLYAKNVLKNTFSSTASCGLTINKPNPGNNFKYSPKFTWKSSDNEVKLEFFRRRTSSTTQILYDDSSVDSNNNSTIAPITSVTSGCKFRNTVKKLAWGVQCTNGNWATNDATIPKSYNTTSYGYSGDNSNTTPTYSISDIKLANSSKNITYTIDYRIRNQYNSNYFSSTDLTTDSAPLQIKLTTPNTIGGITSNFTYGRTDNKNQNKLTINWSAPTEKGLHFKHLGSSSIVAQSNVPNIKTYKVYFYDSNGVYYVYTRNSSSYNEVGNNVTIHSGWGSSDGITVFTTNTYQTTHGSVSTIRLKPETTYTIQKITAINWMFNSESPDQANATNTNYNNGATSNLSFSTSNSPYPPIIGSSKLTVVPQMTGFTEFTNGNGSLISGSGISSTINKLVFPLTSTTGTAITDVLINADFVKGTTDTMGIKLSFTITGSSEQFSSECTFSSNNISAATLTYSGIDVGQVVKHTPADLYNADAGTVSTTLTQTIGTYYVDKNIVAPTINSASQNSYTPYTVCGLPILKSSNMPSIDVSFDNKSQKWARYGNILQISLAGTTTNTSNDEHNWSSPLTTTIITGKSLSGTLSSSLIKNAQISVIAKNCKGQSSPTTITNKYINDPATLSLVSTIGNQSLTTVTISTSGNVFSSNSVSYSSKPKCNVLKVPNNFNPLNDHGDGNQWNGSSKYALLDVTNDSASIAASTENSSQIIIYNGTFVSETRFRNEFGTSGENYHGNVNTILGRIPGTVTSNSVYADENNIIQDTLQHNYRWGIFSFSYKNTGAAAAALNYAEFSLGNNSECNFVSSDLYSSGSKSVANVEIWYKCINNTSETRWNKLCDNDSADKANATNDVLRSYNGFSAAVAPSSGWILNADDTKASSAITSSNESTWASTKRLQFLIKQEVASQDTLTVILAIGIKNSINKFYNIPRAFSNSFVYRSGTGSTPYNATTIG
jgi:exonuclease VII small subunit